MSAKLPNLFANNREWARRTTARDPDFFRALSEQQSPKYLWIGCSDSRVPANEIVGLKARRTVRPPQRRQRRRSHRSELPLGAAIRGRRIEGEHVIVCGHYGCGGVRAATCDRRWGRSTTGCGTCRTCANGITPLDSRAADDETRRAPVRAECHRTGDPCLPDDDCGGCLAARAALDDSRLDLRPARWLVARPALYAAAAGEVVGAMPTRWRDCQLSSSTEASGRFSSCRSASNQSSRCEPLVRPRASYSS